MKNNKGITMIELVISMGILGIVGLMVATVLSTSVRMYQSTVTYADLQTESQTVSRRISNTIMNAENLCIGSSAEGTFLFTGTITAEASKTLYNGEIIWFNSGTNALYYNAAASMESSASPESGATGGIRPLTADVVMLALERGTDVREYLISDNIRSLDFSVFPELKDSDRIKADSDFYALEEKITISYEVVLSNFSGDDYRVDTSATPRNTVGHLYLREEAAGN